MYLGAESLPVLARVKIIEREQLLLATSPNFGTFVACRLPPAVILFRPQPAPVEQFCLIA
jgi:hypothetical protein